MKKILILICCFICCNSIIAQESMEVNINSGYPITRNNVFNLNSFYIESNIQKNIVKNIFLGLGINYSSIDLKPSNTILTYDRNTHTYYTFLGNSFLSKNKKMDFCPQIKVGYSFYSYSMNEFESGKQTDDGFFGAPGIVVKFKTSDKLHLTVNGFYNIIFNSYNKGDDFTIPLNYITTQDKYIKDFNLGVGLSYKIGKYE